MSAGLTEIVAARVNWRDAAVRPNVEWTDDRLNLAAERLAWPPDEPLPFRGDLTLSSANKPLARLKLQGQASDQQAAIQLEAEAVQLDAAAPVAAGPKLQ